MKTVFTKDGVEVEKGTNKYKGHIFYDEDGGKYKCLGYFPKLDDCVYENLQTGKEVVGCMDGFYFKDPTEKSNDDKWDEMVRNNNGRLPDWYAKGSTVEGGFDEKAYHLEQRAKKQLGVGIGLSDINKALKRYENENSQNAVYQSNKLRQLKSEMEALILHYEDESKYAKGSTVEGGGEYRSYVNNIYRNQSEQSAREGLMNFASEQGFEISDVENALQVYKYDTEENAWGENYYTKIAIAKMVDMISGKYANGGGVKGGVSMAVKYFKDKGYKVKKSSDYWVVGGRTYTDEELVSLMNEQESFTFESVGLRNKMAKGSTIKANSVVEFTSNGTISVVFGEEEAEIRVEKGDKINAYVDYVNKEENYADISGFSLLDILQFNEDGKFLRTLEAQDFGKYIPYSSVSTFKNANNKNGVAMSVDLDLIKIEDKYAKGSTVKSSEIVDISKLGRYAILYIPIYDENSVMKFSQKVVIAQNSEEAKAQILSKNKRARIMEIKKLAKGSTIKGKSAPLDK